MAPVLGPPSPPPAPILVHRGLSHCWSTRIRAELAEGWREREGGVCLVSGGASCTRHSTMPTGTQRRGSVDLGARPQRRGSVDLGADRKKKRGLNRTMTAIGMAAPEDAKSPMPSDEPAPEPAPAGDQVRPVFSTFAYPSRYPGAVSFPPAHHQCVTTLVAGRRSANDHTKGDQEKPLRNNPGRHPLSSIDRP